MMTHSKQQQQQQQIDCACLERGEVLCVCKEVSYEAYLKAMTVVWATYQKKFYGEETSCHCRASSVVFQYR